MKPTISATTSRGESHMTPTKLVAYGLLLANVAMWANIIERVMQ